MLCWVPRPLGAVSVIVPEGVAKGSRTTVGVRVDGSPAGVLPVRITLRDGALRLNEYSGYYRLTDGELVLSVPIARNDWGGNWEVTVQDLVGGSVGMGGFLVK